MEKTSFSLISFFQKIFKKRDRDTSPPITEDPNFNIYDIIPRVHINKEDYDVDMSPLPRNYRLSKGRKDSRKKDFSKKKSF